MTTNRRDPRIALVLQRLPRSLFIASPDLRDLISGRGIPSREVVRQMLERIPRVRSQQAVLLVGSGAGYLAAVLSHLAGRVIVLERHRAIADIARRNLAKAGIGNVEFVIGEGEQGIPARMPFGLIVVRPEIGFGFADAMRSSVRQDPDVILVGEVGQLLYTWNGALLKRSGSVPEALVPSPIMRGMQHGKIVRFEELARCPQPLLTFFVTG